MKALRRAGWSVQVVPEWEYVPVRWTSPVMRAVGKMLRDRAVGEFNRALLDQAERFEPEFLLVFKGTFVQERTLRSLSRRAVRSYCFYPDVSFRTHGKYLPRALPAYDWIFSTKSFGVSDLRDQLGILRASLLLHAYDPDLHRVVRLEPEDHQRFACDVSFIGTWSPKKERLLEELIRRRPELRVRVWGAQWARAEGNPALCRAIEHRELAGEDYVRAILASRINLGLLSERRAGASDGDHVTSRTFHIPACGGFMLHERTNELRSLFAEDEEVACFAGPDELVTQVDRYLVDTGMRERVAARGHASVTRSHSWDHRIQDILQHHEAQSR